MFNVIIKLHILEKEDKKILAGEWLHDGEIHEFAIQCESQNVFETLLKMKETHDQNIDKA